MDNSTWTSIQFWIGEEVLTRLFVAHQKWLSRAYFLMTISAALSSAHFSSGPDIGPRSLPLPSKYFPTIYFLSHQFVKTTAFNMSRGNVSMGRMDPNCWWMLPRDPSGWISQHSLLFPAALESSRCHQNDDWECEIQLKVMRHVPIIIWFCCFCWWHQWEVGEHLHRPRQAVIHHTNRVSNVSMICGVAVLGP